MFKEKEFKHESFAMMSFTRVQSNKGEVMHGSNIKHSTFIRMDLKHSSMRRGLNHDWYYGDKLIASVEMSQNQFAELITSMNMGDGIPVTLKRTERDGQMEDPKFQVVTDLHEDEMEKMKNLFSGSTVKKADRNELIKDLEAVLRDIQANMPYVEDCFRETMDKVVTDAKGTIEAFYQHRVVEAGLEALSDGTKTVPPTLIEKD